MAAEDLSAFIEPVARVLLGEPNGPMSSQSELRFGNHGSMSVDLKKGVWHDHEAGEGGGVLDLIERYTKLSGADAFRWLEDNHIKEADRVVVQLGNIADTYDYTDEAGKFLYQVVRFDPKGFRQRHRGAHGDFKWGRGPAALVPYRLPELIEAVANDNVVFVVEGEKDVNNLRKLGIPATSNSGGAGNWDASINKYFADADLVVIADNDPQAENNGKLLFNKDGSPKFPGQDHARHVCAELQNVARRVRYLDLKKAWPACPLKGDISDWLAARGTPEQLNLIADDLPDWSPDSGPLPLSATLYLAPDPAKIPKRAWLHGGHYIRDVCTATVAPGGFGKTTLSLFEALTMVKDGLRVWYISGEDPKVEIDRRIAAHCQHHDFHLGECKGQLFVDDKTSFPFFIAKSPRAASVVFDDPSLAGFEAAIAADKIDVVMLDPFVSFHAVPENDNGAIDAVCKRLGLVAFRAHCCIEISHHVRKQAPGQTHITVDDTRGGGAIVNAVRSSRVINRMTSAEAERAKIMLDQRSSYIRLDRGKRNMAPPDAANWFRILGVLLPNGDNVQSIEEWEFPKGRRIELEDTDWVKGIVREKQYRTNSKSPDWLGIPIGERFELDLDERGDIMFVNRAIGAWIKSGVLVKIIDSDASRRKREFYAVGGEQVDEPIEEEQQAQFSEFDDDNNGD
jgi:hypothetical protein